MALRQPSGHTTYSGFGHAGESMFELTTAHRGTYQVACTGTGSGELAFGRGIGKSIVRILIGVFGTLFAVGVTAVAVFLLRRRRRPL